MCTSVTSKDKRHTLSGKTALFYLAVSALCVIFDRVYAAFGHGVYSASMTLMFLYPLLGGALPFFILWLYIPHAGDVKCYRLLYNMYNSGIAALTVRSALYGVFEIAGTSSYYLIAFSVAGWALALVSLHAFLIGLRWR